jgi:hypothetical protein
VDAGGRRNKRIPYGATSKTRVRANVAIVSSRSCLLTTIQGGSPEGSKSFVRRRYSGDVRSLNLGRQIL